MSRRPPSAVPSITTSRTSNHTPQPPSTARQPVSTARSTSSRPAGPLAAASHSSTSTASPAPLRLLATLDGRVKEWPLSDCRVLVGRARSSTVQLSDGQVSNSHAEIVNGFLQDTGSTNGTTLNDTPVSRTRTQHTHCTRNTAAASSSMARAACVPLSHAQLCAAACSPWVGWLAGWLVSWWLTRQFGCALAT